MGKRIELNPGWLVSLLAQWAVRDIPGRELGYASGSSWMRSLKSSPSTSIVDPVAFSAKDFTDVAAGMEWLHDAFQPDWAAVMMYYKPWTIRALVDLGFPHGAGNKTFYNRLHDGHAKLAKRLDGMNLMKSVLVFRRQTVLDGQD